MINKEVSYKTVSEYIKTLKTNLRIDNFRFENMSNSLICDIFTQYLWELPEDRKKGDVYNGNYTVPLKISFDEDDRNKYRHHAKKLSFDIFGSPDLWFIICILNGFKRDFEFDPGPVMLLPSNEMINKFNSLFTTMTT